MDSNYESCRVFACDIIQNAGILLRLPQVAMTTAQILIQKLYHSTEFKIDNFYLDITAMAALFQAAKIEECRREARQVIDVITYVISTRFDKELTLNNHRYEKVREELIMTERRLLKTLGYKSLLSIHPHKIVVNYYQAIVNALDKDHRFWRERENRKVIQRAWNYCNDSLRIDVFLKLKKEAVACACIQMACEDTQILFPKSTDGRYWYSLFVDDDQDVLKAIEQIRDFYQSPKIDANDLKCYMYFNKLFHKS